MGRCIIESKNNIFCKHGIKIWKDLNAKRKEFTDKYWDHLLSLAYEDDSNIFNKIKKINNCKNKYWSNKADKHYELLATATKIDKMTDCEKYNKQK